MKRKSAKANKNRALGILPDDDNFWYSPAGDYAYGEKRDQHMLLAIGNNQPPYRLDLRKEQKRLLSEYGNIQSDEQYKDWLLEFMGDSKFNLVDDLTEEPIYASAKSLKALLDILRYYEEHNTEELAKLIRQYDPEITQEEITNQMFEQFRLEVERCFCKETTFPWWNDYSKSKEDYTVSFDKGAMIKYDYVEYAKKVLAGDEWRRRWVQENNHKPDKPLPWELNPQESSSDAKAYKQKREMRSTAKTQSDLLKQLRDIEAEVRKKINGEAHFYFRNVDAVFYKVHGGFFGEVLKPMVFSREAWINDREKSAMHLARAYLSQAGNIMLRGIEPGIQYDPELKAPKLRYQLKHPWHAIATAFAERIIKRPLTIRKCHICGEDINHKKSTANLCDKVSCKRALRKQRE